jgi:hypothetical protein
VNEHVKELMETMYPGEEEEEYINAYMNKLTYTLSLYIHLWITHDVHPHHVFLMYLVHDTKYA